VTAPSARFAASLIRPRFNSKVDHHADRGEVYMYASVYFRGKVERACGNGRERMDVFNGKEFLWVEMLVLFVSTLYVLYSLPASSLATVEHYQTFCYFAHLPLVANPIQEIFHRFVSGSLLKSRA
jgi:hypothetical protein